MEENDKNLLVFYISIKNIDQNELRDYMRTVTEKITPKTFHGEIIVIPVYGETRIECINPSYITEEELIRKHRLLMDELHEQLEHHIDQIKNDKENE